MMDYVNKIVLEKWENSIIQLPEKSVSLVVTDPPYGCTPLLWDKRPYWTFFWQQLARVCGERGQAWIFVQERIWQKQNGAGANVKVLRKIHENIWHYKRPKAKTFNLHDIREPKTTTGNKSIRAGKGYAAVQYMTNRVEYIDDGLRMPKSVIFCKNLHQSTESLGHPTQKPEAIIEPLIKYSSNSGDLVYDPFAGTGTTLDVARKLHRLWFGSEMTQKWYDKAVQRLSISLETTESASSVGSKETNSIFG